MASIVSSSLMSLSNSATTTTTTTRGVEKNCRSSNDNKHNMIALYFLVHPDFNKKRNRNRNINRIISLKLFRDHVVNLSMEKNALCHVSLSSLSLSLSLFFAGTVRLLRQLLLASTSLSLSLLV